MPIVDELVSLLKYEIGGKKELADFQKKLDEVEKKEKERAQRKRKGDDAEAARARLRAVEEKRRQSEKDFLEKKREERVRRTGMLIAGGATAAATATFAAVRKFAGLEREMGRIGINADAAANEVVKATSAVQKIAADLALPIDQVVLGLDTLIASGLNLQEAMSFLPSVATTAQASGSSLADIANTAVKVSSALKLEADQMQYAFDIMVAGGKAGQFELKDMAAYIPGLANSFATLGYEGEAGLKTLIAVLQTIREDTGSSANAATQAQNIFGKMYSEAQANNFEKFGIDLRKGMEEGIAAGEGALDVFVRLSKEALNGDLTKLPLLFTDQEFRLGMQSLITSGESYTNFLKEVNSVNVRGGTMKDVNVILGDTQAQLDKTSIQFERLFNNLGKLAAPVVSTGLDNLNKKIERTAAIGAANEKRGMSTSERLLFGLSSEGAKDRRAREGGFVLPGDEARANQDPDLYRALAYESNIALPTEAPPVFFDVEPEENWLSNFAKDLISAGQVIPSVKVRVEAEEITPETRRVPTPEPAPANRRERRTASRLDQGLAPFAALESQIAQTNATLASMTGSAGAEAVITDARQDKREFPITTSVVVKQTITQAVDAPAAVAKATGNAAASAVNERSRVAIGPSF